MGKMYFNGEVYGTDIEKVSDLTDVALSNLSDGQVLKYDSTSQKWVNANESGGGGGGGATYYLHDGLVADESTYISCNLDTNMANGTYIVTLRDTLSNDGLILSSIIEWRGNTITIPFTDIYGTLELTSSTAGLTNYTGSYRKIYCNIIRII